MANSRMLQAELDKNGFDKEMADIELDNSKKRFAEELSGIPYRTLAMKPKRYKRPMKIKIRNFIEQVKILLGL